MRALIVCALLLLGCRREHEPMFETSRVPPRRNSLPADCRAEQIDTVRCPEWEGVEMPPIVNAPKVVHRVEPKLTDAARKHRLTGIVIVQVGIRRDGSVGGVCVLKPLPCGLSGAAIEAVKQWRFEPQQRDVIATTMVHFPPAPSTAF